MKEEKKKLKGRLGFNSTRELINNANEVSLVHNVGAG